MARRSKTKPKEKESAAPTPPATIRKGVYISALIYVEGEQAPADNFTTPAKAALRDALTAALEGERDGLSMALKKLEVRNDVEQEDEKEEEAKGEEKFEF